MVPPATVATLLLCASGACLLLWMARLAERRLEAFAAGTAPVAYKFGAIGLAGAGLAGKWVLVAKLFATRPMERLRGTLEVYDKLRQKFAFDVRNGRTAVQSVALYAAGDMYSPDRAFATALLTPVHRQALHNEYRLYLRIQRDICSRVPVGWFVSGEPQGMVLATADGRAVKPLERDAVRPQLLNDTDAKGLLRMHDVMA